MTQMQVCREAGSRAVVAKRRYVAIPWAEVTPSCLRIHSRGAGWALSTPGVLAGFSHDDLEMARLPRQRH
jgi:hypothetical protein